MSEKEILQSILQNEKIGWWEADMTHRVFRMSDEMRNLLGFPVSQVGFDEMKDHISESYLKYAISDIELFDDRAACERIIEFSGQDRGAYVWKVLRKETTADGHTLVAGYVCPVAHSVSDIAHSSGSERINDLLYRLNSISHSLLSLLHTDKVDDAVNKTLSDIRTMFGAGRAYIIEFDWERRVHICTYEVTADNVRGERDYVNCLTMDETPWWTEQIVKGHPVVLSSLDELPPEACREREILEAQDIRSMLVMPLVSRDKVRGYVGIDLVEHNRHWTNADYQWFSSLVNIIGLCLELQRSEQEAQVDRDYLEGLYRNMPLGYVRMELICDAQGEPCDYRVIDTNYAADEIIGIKRERYVGRTAGELGVDLDRHLPHLLKAFHSDHFCEYDTLIMPGNRSVHCILYSTRRNEIISLFSDTTELQQAHEVLYRNELLLRNIFESMQIGVELYDNDGRLIDLNYKDMEIFGVRNKKEVVGINFYENPNVPDDIREGVRNGSDQAFRLNYPFNKLNGYYASKKTGYLEIYTTVNILYDKQGQRSNFMLINIDNTEINRAQGKIAEFESSFALVSRFGKVGYCRYDLRSGEGYAMPQWYLNVGEKPDVRLSEIIGVYPHLDPADRIAGSEALKRLLDGQIDSFNLDMRVLPEGGGELWTRSNVMRNPLNDDPSKVEIVAVNYDITELKATEKNLIDAKNKAEVSDRLKSAFLANMSHEIRTPLNAIVGFSNLLAESEDPEEKGEFIRIVSENNELLLKLISDILDLSKIEAGTFDFNFGSVDVNQLCAEALRSLSLKVQDRPVELLMGSHEKECMIVGDKSRLMQVITNFINNALKFTAEGSITLGYELRGEEVYFYVEDTGSGISADKVDAIFERFVKLNSFAQGTGLGLSICKSIVEQMKGQIGVESEEGRGSRFWFVVPVSQETDEVIMVHEGHAIHIDGRRPVLLVVEDVDSNFLLESLTLGKEYEIIRAMDGMDAVRFCSEKIPDVVLMDVRLPGMDGLEASQQILRANPKIPIIAVTAHPSDRDRQKALSIGCRAYLERPLPGDVLRQTLRKQIQRK